MNCCQIWSKAIYTSDQLTGLKSTNLPLWLVREKLNCPISDTLKRHHRSSTKNLTLGSFFLNLFHSLPFFITPSQNNLQINMLKKIERFCIDKCTFSKYLYQPKSFKALTILNSWNVRSQQWSKWVNWNITDDGLFPIFIHCIIVAKTWAIACQKSFLSTQAFFWNGLLKQISGEWG